MDAGAFYDDDVTHVEGDVNPVRDLEIISDELRLKDLQYLDKQIVRVCAAVGVAVLEFVWRWELVKL